jgi:hypothetical protein
VNGTKWVEIMPVVNGNTRNNGYVLQYMTGAAYLLTPIFARVTPTTILAAII